jgi:cobalt-zinc-cadmium efflux system protein
MSHSHGGGSQDRRALALVITAAYTLAEVIGGLITGSLALLADAAHMLSDNVSLGLALFAFWLSAKPPTPERSFGHKRAEILAALANGVTLVAVSLWIFYEAYRRFQDPPEILGGWMMAVAVMGLFVNVAAAWVLMRSGAESLNLQGALRHILADLAGSVGVIAAALIILLRASWRGGRVPCLIRSTGNAAAVNSAGTRRTKWTTQLLSGGPQSWAGARLKLFGRFQKVFSKVC